jgi:hypothetical protein
MIVQLKSRILVPCFYSNLIPIRPPRPSGALSANSTVTPL